MMSMEMKTEKQEEIGAAVGNSLLLNKNNGTWMFKAVQEKNHERCLMLSETGSVSETVVRLKSENGMMENPVS